MNLFLAGRALGAVFVVPALLWPATVLAQTQLETFRDWTARLDQVNTGEDLRKTCTASTAFIDDKDEPGSLSLSISDGDALPPYAYPQIVVMLGGDGGSAENIQAGFTDGDAYVSLAAYAAGGGEWHMENQAATSLTLLRLMRKVATLDLKLDYKPVATISMDGFTHTYRKLAEWCGFSADDVAN
jgi:hypothetical protein